MASTSHTFKDSTGATFSVEFRSTAAGAEREVILIGDGELAGFVDLGAHLGADGSTPPAIATGATGLRGWLRAIYERLTGGIAVTNLPATQVVAPTGAGDVASALTDGRKVVATPGTAVAIRASLTCKWVCVTALTSNSGQVNVGGSGVLATLGSSTGTPLAAGQSVTLPVADASEVFVDARVSGEGVSFTVGA